MSIVASYTEEGNYRKVNEAKLIEELDKKFTNNGIEYEFSSNPDGSYTVTIENREYQIAGTGSMVKVEKVTDTTPGELAGLGTEASPYLIESVEDLVRFSYEVRSGNLYEGEYVSLTTDLNLVASESYVEPESEEYETYGYTGKIKEAIQTNGFIPIGDVIITDWNADLIMFKGNFNGNNHTISNFSMSGTYEGDGNYYNLALFPLNDGTIVNLNVVANTRMIVNTNKFGAIGVLVGVNRSNGVIRNCTTAGTIICITKRGSINDGCICGSNEGLIENCANNGNYCACTMDVASVTQCRLAGVCGVNETAGIIKNCYNYGNIIEENSGETNLNFTNYGIGDDGGLTGNNRGTIE